MECDNTAIVWYFSVCYFLVSSLTEEVWYQTEFGVCVADSISVGYLKCESD